MTNNPEKLAASVNAFYDVAMFGPRLLRYYGGSEYTNFGYWEADTADARGACDALMARLLGFIPEKHGQVLDVACGKGETTRYIARHYGEQHVTAINISERQLARGREIVPGGRFLMMDAAALAFPDASFDAVVCVEAAFHFNTRERFLREACRVLKPGGHLVLSDILVDDRAELRHARRIPANYVPDLDAYRQLFLRAGFVVDHMQDATEACWKNHFRHITRYAHEAYLSGELTLDALQQALGPYYERARDIQHYMLVGARKVA